MSKESKGGALTGAGDEEGCSRPQTPNLEFRPLPLKQPEMGRRLTTTGMRGSRGSKTRRGRATGVPPSPWSLKLGNGGDGFWEKWCSTNTVGVNWSLRVRKGGQGRRQWGLSSRRGARATQGHPRRARVDPVALAAERMGAGGGGLCGRPRRHLMHRAVAR